MYTYVPSSLNFHPTHLHHHRAPSRVPWVCSWFLVAICFTSSNAHRSFPVSQFFLFVPPQPTTQSPHIHSLHFYSSPENRFICTIYFFLPMYIVPTLVVPGFPFSLLPPSCMTLPTVQLGMCTLFRIPMEMNLWQIKIPLYIELSFNVTVYIFPLKPSLLYFSMKYKVASEAHHFIMSICNLRDISDTH